MFVKKREEKTNTPKQVRQAGAVSTIASGTTVNGDMESDSDMRIDGNIIGNVYCKAKIVLGESGIIQGDLHATNADVFGTVNGNVIAKDLLCLKAKSTVNGNVNTKRLQIEPNATFNGQCKMTSDQVSGGKSMSDKKVELEVHNS
ncbi:MAG: polymer-forming cytoskeletal protein [Chitinophagaceae bacterium]|nr:polymer-forming cytoskeletal protein [Chitinophagaceae bacterium]MCB9044994.1 polymer-forming cytoskeletal protein [Chitinophagales bacterium]